MAPNEDESTKGETGSGAWDASGTEVAGAAGEASDLPFGPHAAAILAAEHWGLLAARSLTRSSPAWSPTSPPATTTSEV